METLQVTGGYESTLQIFISFYLALSSEWNTGVLSQ